MFRHMGLSAISPRTYFLPSDEASLPVTPELLGKLSGLPSW